MMTPEQKLVTAVITFIALGFLSGLPKTIQSFQVKRAAAAWHAQALAEVPESATGNDILQWLKQNGDRPPLSGPYAGNAERGTVLFTQRVASPGSWFWDPKYVTLRFYFPLSPGNESRLRIKTDVSPFDRIGLNAWSRPAWARQVHDKFGLACSLGIVTTLIVWFAHHARRGRRLQRRQCPDCCYPIGESSVCTECGCKLPAVHPARMASSPHR